MERSLYYFVSDVHLGLDVKDPEARERRFVDFLRSIDAERTHSLFLLGDIWDFWYEYRDVIPKGYVRVLGSLVDLLDKGVEVYFFEGNHDIWTFSYLESLGIRKLQQPHFVELSGRTFCLGHGDGLGPGMVTYKFLRSLFHCRFLQKCFSALHPWFAYRIGNGWSKSSRVAKSFEYVFRGEEEPLYKYCVEVSSRRHVDYFVFGHYHTYEDMTLPSGSRLLMLKDWMDGSPYFFFDGSTGTLGYSPNRDQ